MKRQHPTDPNLFWCPKCQTYKTREEFYTDNRYRVALSWSCKSCTRNRASEYYSTCDMERRRSVSQKWNTKNHEKRLQSCRRYTENNRDKCRKRSRELQAKYRAVKPDIMRERVRDSHRNAIALLNDSYIKEKLYQTSVPFTMKAIELKRQAITIKRIERSMINELAG